MRKLMALTFLGFVCSSLVGCGSSGSSEDNTPVGQCTEAKGVLCDKLFQCLGTNASSAGLGTTAADCKTQKASECIAENVDCLGGKVYQPEKGRACVNAWKALTCTDFASGDVISIEPPVCLLTCASP